MKARSSRRTRVRGFTLIELLVALSGGLFVSVVVFTLARDASRFYQREGRVASATLAAMAGFERLRNDISRAGFMASPNVQTDPYVCTRPGGTAPILMQRLAAIRILNEGSPANTVLANNSIKPDALILAGSFSSPDEFVANSVTANANLTETIVLDERSPALARLGYNDAATPEAKTDRLKSVFAVNRALRIVDTAGYQHYGLIQSVTSGTGGLIPTIVLSATIPIRHKASDSSRLCGIPGHGTGSTVNVVNFIRYDVHKMVDDGDASPYKALFDARTGAYGELERTELVRAELNPADASGTALLGIDGAPAVEELVAEYAVEFDLEPTAITNSPFPDPTLTHLNPVTNAVAFATYTGATGSAERIRSVRVRLSVRTREADRIANVPPAADIAPGNYRILLGTEGDEDRWARLRSLQADIALNNLLGANF